MAEAKYTEANYAHTHNGATGKGHFEGFAQAGTGSVGGAYVSFRGYAHTDESSQC